MLNDKQYVTQWEESRWGKSAAGEIYRDASSSSLVVGEMAFWVLTLALYSLMKLVSSYPEL